MVIDSDWLFLMMLALVAFAGFGLYELRAIHLALIKGN